MESYIVSEGDVTSQDMQLFWKMGRVVGLLPDFQFPRGNEVSCHSLSRALALHFPVKVVDGYFMRGYEHSWLLPEGREGRVLIDIYPVASAVPFIVSMHWLSPWSKMYTPATDFAEKLRFNTFKDQVQQLSTAIAEILQGS